MARQTTQRITRSYGLNDPDSLVVEEWPQTKRDIYEAARALFWEKGHVQASVQDIVDRAGLTKGAFYHYFNAKDDILRVMYERSLERILRMIASDDIQQQAPLAAFAQLTRAMILIANEYRVEVAMFWEQYRKLPVALAAENRARRLELYRHLKRLVERGIADGSISPATKPGVAAMAVIGICQHTVYWTEPGRSGGLEQLSQDITELFLTGMRIPAR